MVDVTRSLHSLWGQVEETLLDGAAARLDFTQGRAAETTFATSMICCAGKRWGFDKRVPRTWILRKQNSILPPCVWQQKASFSRACQQAEVNGHCRNDIAIISVE